jgi:hypothetical protein
LILTPQGRLVLAEYVLAPGVEQLLYSRERLWRELRVALPQLSSPSRIPPSADVVGIGVVALSLLLGRMLGEDEFLVSLGELVESLTETAAGTTRKLSAGFSAWLARALQFDENTGFQSTQEAQISFEEMLAKERSYVTSSAQLDLFIARFEKIAGAPAAPQLPTPRISTEPAHLPAPQPAPPSPVEPPQTAAGTAPESASTAEFESAPLFAWPPPEAVAPDFETPVDTGATAEASGARGMRGGVGWITTPLGVIAAVALIEAGVIAWLLAGDNTGAPTAGQIVIRSQPTGATVVIDAEDRGETPLTTTISAGTHTIGIRVGSTERFLPIEIQPGTQTEMYLELANLSPDASTGKTTAPTGRK